MLNQDFKEFMQSLNDNHVRYLVIGGYAVALHGYPRYTKDIDIWIEMSPDNAANMVKALEQFGFSSPGLQAADFLTPDQIIQLGYPPNKRCPTCWNWASARCQRCPPPDASSGSRRWPAHEATVGGLPYPLGRQSRRGPSP